MTLIKKKIREGLFSLGAMGFILLGGVYGCSGLSGPPSQSTPGATPPPASNAANTPGGIVGSQTEMGQIGEGDKKELQRTLSLNKTALDKKTTTDTKPSSVSGDVAFSFFMEKHPTLPPPDSVTVALVKFGPYSKMTFPIDLGFLNGNETPPLPSGTRLPDLKCEVNPQDSYDDCYNLWRRFLKLEKKGEETYEAALWLPSFVEDDLMGVFIYPDDWTANPTDFQKFRNFQNQATYNAFLKFYFLGFFTLKAQEPHDPLVPVPWTPPSTPHGKTSP